MDIGNQLVTITGGSGDAGTVLRIKGHTGVIRITTTIAKAGECTRDIGTMRTTTMAIGENVAMIATIVITTTTNADQYALPFGRCVRGAASITDQERVLEQLEREVTYTQFPDRRRY
jgi:hypothetical protein